MVEGNKGDVCLIDEAFKECGHQCNLTFVSTKQQASEMLKTRQFDLLISDFGTDGPESAAFIQSIRSNNRQMPIIVLSGIRQSQLAYEAGANAFIEKSCDVDTLFFKISVLMNFWTQVAQLPSRRSHSATSTGVKG